MSVTPVCLLWYLLIELLSLCFLDITAQGPGGQCLFALLGVSSVEAASIAQVRTVGLRQSSTG